jgi:two-component system, LytTR family, response regulator
MMQKEMNPIQFTDVKAPAPMQEVIKKNYFLIKENLVMYKLRYDDVQYISALENYIKIHTPQKTYMVLSTLLQFENSIDNHPFLRVHRSFIVNLNYIASIAKDVISLENDTVQIPLGEQYKKDLENIFIKGKTIRR